MGILDDIKKNANSNGTKIQTSEEAKFETILNKTFLLDKDIEEETKFVKQVMTRGLESQVRVGLHASAMLQDGERFCMRAQILSLVFHHNSDQTYPVGLLRIFEEGNAIHEKWQRLFIRGGYGKAVDMDLTNISSDYHISFTPDIIASIPEIYDGKMVGEIKSVNTYQFKKMKKHPTAWKQAQWYMHLKIKEAQKQGTWNGKDYLKGFVLNEDKNNQEFKIEVYDYDPSLVAPFIDKSEEIVYRYEKFISEKKLIKRPDTAIDPNCKKCKDCFMKDACWNVGKGRRKLDTKPI